MSDLSNGSDEVPQQPQRETGQATRKRQIKRLLALVIFALVAFGITRTVRNASRQFNEQQREITRQISTEAERLKKLRADEASAEDVNAAQQLLDQLKGQRFHWSSIKVRWLVLGSALYTIGMMPSWYYWHLTLRRLGQSPPWRRSFRAFFIGHLGKYVPGKALVVVLRSTMVSGPGVTLSAGVVAVFVETLTLMAVGATVGGVLLTMVSGDRLMIAAAVCLAIAAGVPTLPPLFRRVVDVLQRKRGSPPLQLAGIDWRHMACGWLLIIVEWFFFGGSLAATLVAIPGISFELISEIRTISLITATVSLAMVLGFVSLVPGGAGIREWVVTTALGSVAGIGPIRALVAAILLRFVWLIPELLISAATWRDSEQTRE
jgi:uncharacterized membrane protein YbhN (UPF0104 family)